MVTTFNVTIQNIGNHKSKTVKIASSTDNAMAAAKYAELAYPGWLWTDVRFISLAV